jgi:serine/threonine protein phosphatase 1
MSTIAIGDIHGHRPALEDLLGQLLLEVRGDDVVVFLGDYIDRGPDSKGCVDAILGFKEAVDSRVVCLCGNHEDWMLRTLHDHSRHSWLMGMEAFDTIESYSPAAAASLRDAVSEAGVELYTGECRLPCELFFDALPPAHRRFFETLVPYHRTPDCVCVHGGLDAQIERLDDQPRDAFVWGANGFPDAYAGRDVVVYGHRNNAEVDADGWPAPKRIGLTIGLDTIAHRVLTAIRLPDGRVYQAAERTARQT